MLSLAAHLGLLEPGCFGRGLPACRAGLDGGGDNQRGLDGGAEGVITSDAQSTASLINGMLLCAEMLIASLVHPFVFPPEDYAPNLLLGPAYNARRPGDGHLGPSLGATMASKVHGPSLHAALLEALIPKDVAEHVRQASWGVLNPQQLGMTPQHRRLYSGSDLADGGGSPGRHASPGPLLYTPPSKAKPDGYFEYPSAGARGDGAARGALRGAGTAGTAAAGSPSSETSEAGAAAGGLPAGAAAAASAAAAAAAAAAADGADGAGAGASAGAGGAAGEGEGDGESMAHELRRRMEGLRLVVLGWVNRDG